MRMMCNPENITGGEAHYANRSSFDWVVVEDKARFLCEDCRMDIRELEEVTNG